MRSRARTATSALVTTAAAFALATVVAAPADAAPAAATCSKSFTYSTGSIRCTGTTRQYRAKVGCTDQLRGSFYGYVYGPYVNPGQTSGKTCPYQGNVQFQATSVDPQYR